MKVINNKNVPIISMIFVLVFFLFYMIINQITPFGASSFVVGDCKSYIYPYMVVFRDKMHSRDDMFYYWNGALGDGFLPSYFYVLSSPINYLVYFISVDNIDKFISITIVVRIILAAGTFGFYIVKKHPSSNVWFKVTLSISYALSGFILGYFSQSYWLDSYLLFPLIIYGYDKMMKERKSLIYVLCLVLSAFCSFFMTYMIGMFLVLYFLFDDHNGKKAFLSDLISFVLNSLLAVGMAAFPIIISAYSLKDTRVGISDGIAHEWFGNIFNIIKYHFFMHKTIMINYNNNVANLYCGLFAVLLLIIYFIASKVALKNKIKKLIFLSFLLISMNESILNYVWHGFHLQNGVPNRFSFMYIFIILDMCIDALEDYKSERRLYISVIIAEILPLVTFVFVSFDGYIDSGKLVILQLSLILIYSILIIMVLVKKSKVSIIVFSCIALCEIFVQSSFSLYNLSEPILSTDMKKIRDYASQMSDDDLYRSKISGMITFNNELITGLNSAPVFGGYININTLHFLEKCGYFSSLVEIKSESGFSPIDDILGFRYYYKTKDIYNLKDEYYDYMGYDLIDKRKSVNIYKNNNAANIGFGINNSKINVNFTDNPINNTNSLIYSMTGIDNVMEEIYPVYNIEKEGYDIKAEPVENVKVLCTPQKGYDKPYIKLSFVAEKSGLYSTYMNFTNNGFIEILINGNARRHCSKVVSPGIFTFGNINEGDLIEIVIGTSSYQFEGVKNNPVHYLELRTCVLNHDKYSEFINSVKRNPLHIVKNSSSKLSGQVSLEDNQILFTSIPYDDGWHIYENGKELKKIKLAGAFIGLDLGEGEHDLEFKFVPQGLYAGLIVTVCSWVIFAGLCIFQKKLILKKSSGDKSEENSEDESEDKSED